MLHLKPACLLVLSGMFYIQYMYIVCQLPQIAIYAEHINQTGNSLKMARYMVKTLAALYNNYKNTLQLVGSEICA
jgi:hypothetical protein